MRVLSRRLIALALLVLPLLAAWGCGSSAANLPSLIPVKGKVTYKGRPLTQGVVRFEPDGYGRPANGTLGSDGTFVLTTLKEGDGIVAGQHRVYVTGTGKTVKQELIPKKYTSPNTSKLTADVDTEHTEFTFDLTDAR
jgi:hypothetical protein